MLNVIVLNVVMPNLVMLSFAMLNVVILSVITPCLEPLTLFRCLWWWYVFFPSKPVSFFLCCPDEHSVLCLMLH